MTKKLGITFVQTTFYKEFHSATLRNVADLQTNNPSFFKNNQFNMEKINIKFEDNIAETLLIPLWMRAQESKRSDALLHDETSEKLVEFIDYDFEKFSVDKKSQVGVALRTRYLDKIVKDFIESHEHPVILMGGCGLDPRMSRIQTSHSYMCYDLDLQEVIEYRKVLIPEVQNEQCISGSLFDTGWMTDLKDRHPNGNFLFIVEGVLMYFEEEVVRKFVNDLSEHFPGSELYIERVGTLMSKNTKHHSSVNKTKAEFVWGCNDPQTVLSWNPSIKLISQYYFMKDAPIRTGFLGMLAKLFFWRSCGIWGFIIN